mgnify:CR=1 FL=1
MASHLVKKHYDEPVWSKKREQASVKEKVTLYGLEIAADKWVFYGNIDKKYAREMLIRYGLIEGEINLKADFFTKNNDLLETVKFIKKKLKNYKVLYGGSVNLNNINELKLVNNIDGFLIGGASQNSKKFIDIIKKTYN